MASLFGIAAAAFAIGLTTNAGMPHSMPPKSAPDTQQEEIIVQPAADYPVAMDKTSVVVPVPTPKPAQDHMPEDGQNCFSSGGVLSLCPVTTTAAR